MQKIGKWFAVIFVDGTWLAQSFSQKEAKIVDEILASKFNQDFKTYRSPIISAVRGRIKRRSVKHQWLDKYIEPKRF